MKPADIWTTLRLPTRLSPRSPTFSLNIQEKMVIEITLYENDG